MGNCLDPPKPSPRITESRSLPENGGEELEKVKLLLLGAGESGKSTLFKQMQINYVQDHSQESIADQKPRILRAIYSMFNDFYISIKKVHGLGEDIEIVETGDKLFPDNEVKFPQHLTEEAVQFMKAIWNSASGKDIWENHARYPVTDSLNFFMNDLDRFLDKGYIPTETDYLRTRIQTAGIHEQSFRYRGVNMTVVDVGGQRAERKKWLKCIDNCTAVLFVAALSAFDQALYEDTTVMRLPEALTLFKKTFNFLPFRLSETPFVLFLNKQDLLEEKLAIMEKQGKNLDDYFPGLSLGTNYENAVPKVKEYIRTLFLEVCTEQQRNRVIPHYITATDKGIFLKVFQAAAQVVLRQALAQHFNPTDDNK